MSTVYRVRWDNGHACGTLPGEYDSMTEAEIAGASWAHDMIVMDDDPVTAASVYEYEVVQVEKGDSA